jgi:hypothetical protein
LVSVKSTNKDKKVVGWERGEAVKGFPQIRSSNKTLETLYMSGFTVYGNPRKCPPPENNIGREEDLQQSQQCRRILFKEKVSVCRFWIVFYFVTFLWSPHYKLDDIHHGKHL